MVSTSLMVDTIPVPPHPILLCALNYALTLDQPVANDGYCIACPGLRVASQPRLAALRIGHLRWVLAEHHPAKPLLGSPSLGIAQLRPTVRPLAPCMTDYFRKRCGQGPPGMGR